jgi:predicted nucleic acid-binding protein
MATDAVVDSSVIVALVTHEKYSEWASKSVQKYEYFHILDLSFYEVANAIQHKISDNLNEKDCGAAFKQVEKMMNLCSIHSFSEVITDALNKAVELEISVYDAAVLSLSNKLGMKLLTLDQKLAKKLENTKYDDLIEYPNKKTANDALPSPKS